jgi:hypothetical protein
MAYCARGRHAEAEPLLRRAVAIDEASLDPGHPDLANHRANLARLREARGRGGEAEASRGRASAVERGSSR